MLKNPSANAGDIRDVGSIPGTGRSPGGHSSILAREIPWTEEAGGLHSVSHKELDMTEQLSTHGFFFFNLL